MTEAKKLFITWSEIDTHISYLAEKIKKEAPQFTTITGLPRGGLIPAVMLSHFTGLEYIDFTEAYPESTLIVDDIVDSGRTIEDLNSNGYYTVSLFTRYSTSNQPKLTARIIPNDDWLVFPWERVDSKTIQDYLA